MREKVDAYLSAIKYFYVDSTGNKLATIRDIKFPSVCFIRAK